MRDSRLSGYCGAGRGRPCRLNGATVRPLARRDFGHDNAGTKVPMCLLCSLVCSTREISRPGTRREVSGVSEAGPRGRTTGMEPVLEELSEAESLRLIGEAQIGRIGFTGRFGPVVLPVNFKLVDG